MLPLDNIRRDETKTSYYHCGSLRNEETFFRPNYRELLGAHFEQRQQQKTDERG
jgi:hypothetical protein